MPELRFRPLAAADQSFLWDVFHIALWDPPPAPLRPRSLLQHPDVRIYAEEWGREGDVGVVAEVDGKPAGACWMRLLTEGKGLAYVDDETPQLGIALLPEFQHRGYGEPLMRAALAAARPRYRRVSLTVHPQNPAARLYARCGFVDVDVRRTYLLMLWSAEPDRQAPLAAGQTMALEELTLDKARPLAGTRFEAALPDGRSVALTLERVEGFERDAPGRRAPFSLFFLGPRDPILPEASYALRGDRVAWPPLFLVPIGRDERGVEYQAAFT